jgi:hypothetical protein
MAGIMFRVRLPQLEAAAAVVREEKRKGEAALEAAEARFDAREALLHEEAARCERVGAQFVRAHMYKSSVWVALRQQLLP